jgi:alpha-L-rhamnosidase
MKYFLTILLFSLLVSNQTEAQTKDWSQTNWNAFWIKPAEGSATNFGVHLFRKSFELPEKPGQFLIHVSGDQRYELYVNGIRASAGPARRDLFHWKYETVDLAPFLQSGKNVLAARIWNFAQWTGLGEMSSGASGFILQGNSEKEEVVNTNETWKWLENKAWQPIKITQEMVPEYYVVGPGEQIDASVYPWNWETLAYNDEAWKSPEKGPKGSPRSKNDSGKWMLIPSDVPAMESRLERIPGLRKSTFAQVPKDFPGKPVRWTIPVNRKDTFLLDQSYLTNAYPELFVSGGKGAKITLLYAEGLFEKKPKEINSKNQKLNNKGNRNEVNGKVFIGNQDVFLPNGGQNRVFRPLWFRTWRYIQLIVETKEEPLDIQDLRGEFTGFPLVAKSTFTAGSSLLDSIVNTGIRTARLCAHETYFDCPYYEQLQYVGDTRIQALVSYYTFGEDHLAKQAIRAIYNSRQAEGFTASRYPTNDFQIIPTFSLLWIGMLHDFWKYRDDKNFAKEMLPGTRTVLDFFNGYAQSDGTIKDVPWWNFMDWTATFPRGVPKRGSDGRSAHMDLLHLHALQLAAEMEENLGDPNLAKTLKSRIETLKTSIQKLYWDPKSGLYADVITFDQFSQHVNSLAVITGVCPPDLQKQVMEKTMTAKDMAPCTIYFKYYLHQAATKAGLGENYLSWLSEWRKQLSIGLTTWAESPEPSRSDCHAWGCSPNIEFYRTVLGIDSDAPGFATVKITPHLGDLKKAEGKIPHPKGLIEVKYSTTKNGLTAEITLPEGLTGKLVWKEKEVGLKVGKQVVEMR